MEKFNQEKMNKCIKDLKKIIEAEKIMADLEYMKDNNSNIARYLDYIISNNTIGSLEEIFYIIKELPEISESIAECLRTHKKRGVLVDVKPDVVPGYSPHAGGYNSLSDVPGYGTEWNERCIPDGVYIKHNNRRC